MIKHFEHSATIEDLETKTIVTITADNKDCAHQCRTLQACNNEALNMIVDKPDNKEITAIFKCPYDIGYEVCHNVYNILKLTNTN